MYRVFCTCRYYAIKSPFTYNVEKIRSKLICMFISTWLIGFATQIPMLLHFYTKMYRYKIGVLCSTLMLDKRWIALSNLCFGGVVSLFAPFGIMVYVYTKMGLILYSGRKMGQDDSNSASSARIKTLRKAHSNILQTCLLLSLIYFVTYAAYSYQMFAFVAYKGGSFQTIELYITQYTIALNSWLNPFVYVCR